MTILAEQIEVTEVDKGQSLTQDQPRHRESEQRVNEVGEFLRAVLVCTVFLPPQGGDMWSPVCGGG